MENSVGSAIEKIKLHEQDKEAKLKEKREFEANIAFLQRNLKEINTQIHKCSQEEGILTQTNIKLKSQLDVEKIRNKALSTQIELLKKDLIELQQKINQDISYVWTIRSSFCETVQKTSNKYNVWALLMKPMYAESIQCKIKKSPEKPVSNIGRLEAAIERRNKATAERNRLMAEPDHGEEFVRIKNALRYSLEKVENLKENIN
ncbi:uncharacterized protein LOC119832424 [Zerene cesonia]|uniref:uncharacterized protein LOC119832424 n=1 Tax=Zerene cesonia TaxID=33412 RepID=UPI0018E4F2EB|nr:uncharacterized protein LOC119832424 [Zerene cesonia]